MSPLFPLKVELAVARHRKQKLVGPLTLELSGNGICVVIGPNGSGKTSMLRLLHGTERLASGHITWACGTAKARVSQSFVFQRPIILRRSVLENIAYPLRIRGTPKPQANAHAEQWAAKVGLAQKLGQAATALSGGEQQKLAIARALITNPALVFLDEPCASLDGRSMRDIEMILTRAAENGTSLIVSTHDMGQARRLANEVVFLHQGQIGEHSAASSFFEAPETKHAAAFLKGDIVE